MAEAIARKVRGRARAARRRSRERRHERVGRRARVRRRAARRHRARDSISSAHRARQLNRELVAAHDLILAMGPHHVERIEAVGGTGRAFLLTTYGSRGANDRPDRRSVWRRPRRLSRDRRRAGARDPARLRSPRRRARAQACREGAAGAARTARSPSCALALAAVPERRAAERRSAAPLRSARRSTGGVRCHLALACDGKVRPAT